MNKMSPDNAKTLKSFENFSPPPQPPTPATPKQTQQNTAKKANKNCNWQEHNSARQPVCIPKAPKYMCIQIVTTLVRRGQKIGKPPTSHKTATSIILSCNTKLRSNMPGQEECPPFPGSSPSRSHWYCQQASCCAAGVPSLAKQNGGCKCQIPVTVFFTRYRYHIEPTCQRQGVRIETYLAILNHDCGLSADSPAPLLSGVYLQVVHPVNNIARCNICLSTSGSRDHIFHNQTYNRLSHVDTEMAVASGRSGRRRNLVRV
mmetsp:Transcript_102434/g.176879  ORF Transcript_102434/g.176879 Transcript_102434/m.176879 type:complete len:260 (+) Transcript_102434:3-782(+)